MRRRLLVVAALACAVIPLIGAAQGKPSKETNRTSADEPAAVFRIVELGEEKSLKWSDVQIRDVRIPLTIVNDGKAALSAVVTATPFLGAAAPAAVQLDGKSSPLPIQLAAHKPVGITLSATLSAAATYRSTVEISAAGVKPLYFTVEMERKRVELPIDVREIAAKRTEVVPWSATGSSVDFVTTGTAIGDSLSVEQPYLQAVTYSAKADGSVKSAAPDVKLTAIKPENVTTTVVPENVKFTLAGIRQAGRYDATVRLRGDAYQGKDVAVTVYAREPGWLAVVLIAFGLLVSIGLRTFANFTRPRQQNEQRAATLFAELQQAAMEASGDEISVGLVQQLRRDLTDFWNDLVAKGKLTDLAALDIYDLKVRLVPLWISLRKRVKTLKPASVQSEFSAELDSARVVLINRAATNDDVNTQVKALDGMPVAMDSELLTALSAQVTKLRAEVERDARPEARAIAAEMKKVGTPATLSDLPAALARIDELQRQYYIFCATELSQRLPSDPPTGVLPGEWNGTTTLIGMAVTRIRDARTGAEAGDEFVSAWRRFLVTTATGLQREVVNRIGLSNKPEPYKVLKEQLDGVLESIKAGDLHTASHDLDVAIEAFKQLLKGAALGGVEQAALTALTGLVDQPAAGSSDVVDMWRGGASAEALQRPDAMRVIGASAAASFKLFLFAVIVLAIATGFKTLWLDDWIWGGSSAYLAAFLWGVAFDQFSQAGLTALIRR
jgi:hypothetical protein